jgi:hypothetical protein
MGNTFFLIFFSSGSLFFFKPVFLACGKILQIVFKGFLIWA